MRINLNFCPCPLCIFKVLGFETFLCAAIGNGSGSHQGSGQNKLKKICVAGGSWLHGSSHPPNSPELSARVDPAPGPCPQPDGAPTSGQCCAPRERPQGWHGERTHGHGGHWPWPPAARPGVLRQERGSSRDHCLIFRGRRLWRAARQRWWWRFIYLFLQNVQKLHEQ